MTNIELEERICACGCKKTFRSLPTSPARYSSHFCMEAAGVLPEAPPAAKGAGLRRKARAAREDAGEQPKGLGGAGEIVDKPAVDPAA